MDKAYIVANEQQEMAVLRIMEQQGYTWNDCDIPTHCIPSHYAQLTFPYVLTNHNFIGWLSIDDARLLNFTVLFDGRKEEKMSDKYVVSQEFMNELEEWKNYWAICLGEYVDSATMFDLLRRTKSWWVDYKNGDEQNNRLIAIIRWINGEDVFEFEKPKKWIVRSKDSNDVGEHMYLRVTYTFSINHAEAVSDVYATKFDTREEAESWANSHQEVVEVNDD